LLVFCDCDFCSRGHEDKRLIKDARVEGYALILEPTKKKIPHIQRQRRNWERHQRPLDVTNKILCATRTQGKEAVFPTKIEPDLPVSVSGSFAEAWVSSGLLLEQGHWQQ